MAAREAVSKENRNKNGGIFMKVVAVLGSPKKDGASSTIAKEILRGAEEAGHEVVIYDINDMNMKGCQACGYCKQNRVDCILNDDLMPYWKDLHECGVLVLASPNYCSQVAGPMITFMNRHYCLMMSDGPRIKPGIKLIGVFSQGNQQPDTYLDNYKWYLNDFEARKMQLHELIIHTSAMPYDKESEIIKRAYEIGKAL
ncbi:MAG: flavodoxin family protein [Fusicatenibacter sp.]